MSRDLNTNSVFPLNVAGKMTSHDFVSHYPETNTVSPIDLAEKLCQMISTLIQFPAKFSGAVMSMATPRNGHLRAAP